MHPLDRAIRLVVPCLAVSVLGAVAVVGWFTQPGRLAQGYAPEQPLPFSHRLHAGTMKMSCLYCHSGADRSRVAGVPDLETCMGCHRVTRTGRPAIRRLAALHAQGAAVPWKRVHELPGHVFFDHRPHVGAGIACQSCHGEVQAMDVLARRMSMRMSNCLACHRDPAGVLPAGSPITRGAEHCSACHR
jgi:hypothetical protein